jgi:hypothetical protein
MAGAELVALIAVIGTTLSGILTTLFHSRCSKIRCCGAEGWVSCDREVMNETEITAQPVVSPSQD